MKRLTMVVLLMSGFLSEPTLAQSVEAQGPRVRVTTTTDSIFIGYLVGLSDEDLMIHADSNQTLQVVPRSEITAVEQSLGLRRAIGTRFAVVFFGSVVVSGLSATLQWSPCTDSDTYNDSLFGSCFLYPTSRVGALFFGMAAGALVGLPLGLVVGLSGPKRERWAPLALPAPGAVELSIRPVARPDRGLSLRVAVSARIGG